jgi:ketosteroid isomerase-like protein
MVAATAEAVVRSGPTPGVEADVPSTDILERMERAMTTHDLDGLFDCYVEDFRSEHPIHPQRSFVGREQVRTNWKGLFAHVPDLVATVLQSVVAGDQIWSEWEMSGRTVDAGPYLVRGVAILQLREGRVASTRFYLDNVDAPEPTRIG